MRIVNPKHLKELYAAAKAGDISEDGLIHRSVRPIGVYTTSFNGGQHEQVDFNLIPVEGLLYSMDVTYGAVAKPGGLYLAPFNGANPPDSTWTGANFTANAGEITATNPGFSNATRPAWTPGVATDPTGIDNLASRAVFNTVCPASSVIIAGVGLIANDSLRGGIVGKLCSAMRYDNPRTSDDGDAFEVGYSIILTDS